VALHEHVTILSGDEWSGWRTGRFTSGKRVEAECVPEPIWTTLREEPVPLLLYNETWSSELKNTIKGIKLNIICYTFCTNCMTMNIVSLLPAFKIPTDSAWIGRQLLWHNCNACSLTRPHQAVSTVSVKTIMQFKLAANNIILWIMTSYPRRWYSKVFIKQRYKWPLILR
jgi:hypothetical protein